MIVDLAEVGLLVTLCVDLGPASELLGSRSCIVPSYPTETLEPPIPEKCAGLDGKSFRNAVSPSRAEMLFGSTDARYSCPCIASREA